jgi:hypothetical protein
MSCVKACPRRSSDRKFSELDDKNEDDQPLIKAVRLVYPSARSPKPNRWT